MGSAVKQTREPRNNERRNKLVRRFSKLRKEDQPESEYDPGPVVVKVQDPSKVIGTELHGLLAGRQHKIVLAARSFLPRILHGTLAPKVETSGTILHECNGCVVFSDASGFTKLTETLAQKADGAEVLSKCLNKFFTPLIDIIEAYRGDVIKFSGDALSILFEATDDYTLSESPCGSPEAPRKTPLQLACLRASACCLEIHKRLHNFDTGEGGVRLALHIGVGAGDITMLQVGGEQDRYEYVITGAPLEQISIAEPLASSGETVLSPQTWMEVEQFVIEGAPLDTGPPGFHRLCALDTLQHTYPTIKQAALDCTRVESARMKQLDDRALLRLSDRFIPRCVIKHLHSGNYTSINEIRSVTIVFVQIGGVDVGTEAGSRKAQDLMLGMQRACYRHEGSLNKFLVDDKGILFLFVFGLPPCVHIDDPERAITSCFDMIRVLEGMEMRGRFGVTTGSVYCGIVGSDNRREYTVMGDTVNLSARLMANAPENAMLVDEATYQRTEHKIRFERLEPIMVKGKAKPVQTFAPVVPAVHELELKALAPHLSQLGWDQDITPLDSPPCRAGGFRLPWRARSHLYGGASPLLKLERWRELRRLNHHIAGPGGLLATGGILTLLGPSGIGKQEVSEHFLYRSIEAGLTPLFGTMRSRHEDLFKACAQLAQNCVKALAAERQSPELLASVAEQVVGEIVEGQPLLARAAAFLGFRGFGEPPAFADELLMDGLVDIIAAMVRAVAASTGVLVLLRLRRGTDIFDGMEGSVAGASLFWKLRARLSALALERKRDIRSGKALSPILVVCVARKMPDPGTIEAAQCERADQDVDLPDRATLSQSSMSSEAKDVAPIVPWRLEMRPLTADATVEFMCHCLKLETKDGGRLVKRSLREFTFAVSIGIPVYIQECIHHLQASGCIEVKGGECIMVHDPSTVNIAEWVHSSMVGGTITQLENLGPAKSHIMKLATVFEGPFSPLDLAAANRALFGRVPRILSLYDQAKLLTACKELHATGYLRSVHASRPNAEMDDRAPVHLPRWTVSNSLLRKVAGSMLLQSQKILIKRAVLVNRALNFELGLKRNGPPSSPYAGGVRSLKTGYSIHTDYSHDESLSLQPPSRAVSRISGMTMLQKDSFAQLLLGCAHGDSAGVSEILKFSNCAALNKSDQDGYTPLHVACGVGALDVVRVLCEYRAEVDVRSARAETPVLLAAQRGHVEVVQYLCESCDALNLCGAQDVDFWARALPELTSDSELPQPVLGERAMADAAEAAAEAAAAADGADDGEPGTAKSSPAAGDPAEGADAGAEVAAETARGGEAADGAGAGAKACAAEASADGAEGPALAPAADDAGDAAAATVATAAATADEGAAERGLQRPESPVRKTTILSECEVPESGSPGHKVQIDWQELGRRRTEVLFWLRKQLSQDLRTHTARSSESCATRMSEVKPAPLVLDEAVVAATASERSGAAAAGAGAAGAENDNGAGAPLLLPGVVPVNSAGSPHASGAGGVGDACAAETSMTRMKSDASDYVLTGIRGSTVSFADQVSERTNYAIDIEPSLSLSKRISKGSRKAIVVAGTSQRSWRQVVRSKMRSRTVLFVMLICLALALYTPDALVSSGVPGDTVNDVVLTVVMFLFLTELFLLCLVDASYPFSFFFWMDALGTASMVLDLTYLLGQPDARKTQLHSEHDLTFFRATRTAKVAARAGRLSRLVKLMRFLPGLGKRKDLDQAEQLRAIQNKLTNMLSKRIAFLTILLVIVMPLLTIGLYPDGDLGMSVWTESLSRAVAEGPVAPATSGSAWLERLIGTYASFYKGQSYGPYRVCFEEPAKVTGCHDLRLAFSEPARLSFRLDVFHEGTIASFDFSDPSKAEANMGILLISIIVVLMCGACLLLNYTASQLAVRPLEHMFSSIKGSANAIFYSVQALEVEESDDEDGEGNEEVELLERVIRKIATLVELSSKNADAMKAMKNEELGALGLTATATFEEPSPHHLLSENDASNTVDVTLTMRWQLEEIGIAYEHLNSWEFNVLDVPVQNHEPLSVWFLLNNPGSCAYTEQNVDMGNLQRFVTATCNGYHDNEYHNFYHAVDVTHCIFRYLTIMQAGAIFSQLEQFGLLVAGISHDIGHVGVNNTFLVETRGELAIRYNDRSPLENMHCCRLFENLAQADANIFASTTSDQYRELRKMIIRAILHTDIVLHAAMVKELELLYEMNSKVFDQHAESGVASEQVNGVLSTADNKILVAKLIVHAADTSNPTKPFHIAKAWAWRILDECALQGDQERSLGIPVMMLNDREKLNRPSSQIGFIEFIITPFVAASVKLLPSWYEVSVELEANIVHWEQMWAEETSPADAEREKVRERVRKICAKLNNGKHVVIHGPS
eukprot:TRINITY_DN1986_c0_g1_i1.p1 TRINITY_DN1986_c0_g1~~TRINITY_DN1986_c0_g1_i1.p1  ORF type:complete len:2362 (-),score=606.06 TRINITY_DN1986_c0_g1_i1:70-7155(-)